MGVVPADVLHEEGELCGVEAGVVRRLRRVGIAAAVEVWDDRWVNRVSAQSECVCQAGAP